jgi:hypothetical protein
MVDAFQTPVACRSFQLDFAATITGETIRMDKTPNSPRKRNYSGLDLKQVTHGSS